MRGGTLSLLHIPHGVVLKKHRDNFIVHILQTAEMRNVHKISVGRPDGEKNEFKALSVNGRQY
jgi:hypothetical protein